MSTSSTGAVVQGNDGSPSNELSNLRSKVVEILAGTANGCLTELGYYPGMPQRLQELERQNAEWQRENVKLFQDNQALNHALQERKNSQQEKTINALQGQIQGLLQEKSMLMNQNQILLAGQPVAYQNLLAEYKKTQEQLQRALREIWTFRRNNVALNVRTPIQSPVTPGTVVHHLPIYNPQGALPQVQRSPSSTVSFSVVAHSPAVNPKQSTMAVPNQHSKQIAQGDQHLARTPTSTMPNAQQTYPQSSTHPLGTDKDVNLPSSISRAPRSQAFQPGSSTSSSRAKPLPLFINTSAATGQIGKLDQRNTVNYLPAPLSAPPTSQGHPLYSTYAVETSSSHQTCHVTNSIMPSRKDSLSPNFSRPMKLPAFVKTPSALQMSQPGLPVIRPITVMPKDTISDPSSNDLSSNEEQKPSFGSMNAPLNQIYGSASPAIPFEAVTPMNDIIDDPPPVTIVSTPPIESLKRPGLITPDVEELPTPKKPRLEERMDVDGSVEPAVDTKELPVASAEEDPEDSEDEEVRVGPDGLRLVEDCLAALIGDDEENAEMKVCKLCIARFRLGYTTEPKPFINAMTEELVQHCMSEHQSAWERLRNTV